MVDPAPALPILPLGIEDLLTGAVESSRLELKASWDDTRTAPQVIQTVCAFANDLQNLNGGYIVIGVREENGRVLRPVEGLEPDEIEAAQRWLRGNCNRIRPVFMPVLAPARIDGRHVLVVWAHASETRPHQAPDRGGDLAYFVRVGSDSVGAVGELLTRLLQQTSRVPFDDRRAQDARIEDVREMKVREFLRDVGSELVDEPDAPRVYRACRLTRPVNGHEAPRNVALLFFADDPERWFRGARVEVVHFGDGAGGNVLEERVFRGGLHEQVRQTLAHLESLSARYVEKAEAAPESRAWASFPRLALREAVVNAIYHRSYEESVEPTKVYVYPDRIEVISYPGPLDGIDVAHLESGLVPPVPARNRRIGELLKELRLSEGRGTGVPKMIRSMRENGSPRPRFEFDGTRAWFRLTLSAHPEHVARTVLEEFAYLAAAGEEDRALRRLDEAWRVHRSSALIAEALVREQTRRGDLEAAARVERAIRKQPAPDRPAVTGQDALSNARAQLAAAMSSADQAKATEILRQAETAAGWVARTAGESVVRAAGWYLVGEIRRARAAPRDSVIEAFQRAVQAAPTEPSYLEALEAERRG